MGHRWKRWYSSTSSEPEIDLLSTAFGLPSRRDLERASETVKPKPSSRYDSDSDATSDNAQVEFESYDSSDQSSIHGITIKSRNKGLDHLVSPIPKSASRKRQHTQSRSSSLKSQRSTLSKKIKGSRKLKNTTRDYKQPSPTSTPKDKEPSSTSTSPSTYLSTANGLQGSQKSSSSPSWINSNAQQAAPNKTSQPPLLYSQQQLPTFLPHYVPTYLFHQQKDPLATPTPKRNQDASSYSLGSYFQELQELQELQLKLDRLRRELLKEPTDSHLHKDYQNTQSQLNNILDSVVARKTKGVQQSSLNTAEIPADAMKSTEPIVDKENVAPAPVNDEVAIEAHFPSVPQGGRDRTLSIAHLREKSPSCTIRHHLCSCCGSVRSRNFHEKHPIDIWPKPVLNFCSSCREVTLQKGQMDKHHFCFGCGKVRSKAFQKKHKPKPGLLLLPNYCGKCTAEVRVKEDLDDISVLELTAQSIRPPEHDGSVADTASSTVADLFRHGSPHCNSDLPPEEIGVKTSKSRNAAKLRLGQASIAKSSSAPVSPAESSPFYPGRRSGSAQRRAQREPAPHINGEHRRKTHHSVIQGEYHAPYVEEMDSVSENRTSLRSHSRVESLGDETFSKQYRERSDRKSSRERVGTADQKLAPMQSPGVIYERTAALQSSNSSGERTIQCDLPIDSSGQHSKMTRESPQYNPQDLPHQGPFHEPSKFSKGVFGKNNKDSGCGSGQAIRQKSPLADIEYSHYTTTFSNGEEDKSETRTGATEKPETPQFRSSRGAFGPDYSPKRSHFSMFQFGRTGSNRSGTRSPDATENNRPAPSAEWEENSSQIGTGEYSQPGHRNSTTPSFSSGSNASKPTNKFKPHIPNETAYARSVFTDYSRSIDNPYYKPRSRPIHNATNSDFCSTWDWKSNRGASTQNPRPYDRHFHDGVPEPIIEEPASPPSSPVQPTKLLEFHIPNDSSSSWEPETEEDNNCLAERIDIDPTVSFSEVTEPMSAITQ
ncbi:hypothetical protein X797_004102 [Metarhizium robertsii]|uniref:Ankyrin repeat-containing domain protein n=2 Tax=Metarhizium robertsii TaxID=568076 RepID=A0A0B2XGX6_METRA|nr:Ankyrin repeat-containing domain protein [Metarhizium robertsii ARSEF 23]EXV02979.1 hypothetical protein X797_004102 [Metarhizium robertsii]KHO11136.1 Ankyrin repeat-containing domain protein [Metarhizium robertsii ARSEF 23]